MGVMASTDAGVRVDEVAQRLCDVLTQFALAVPRGRRGAGDLKEVEYLTLSILYHQGTLIVGDIQRQLGVLPAQMSRVIRALENRERPLIACRINPHDKRKIDVSLTPAGAAAFREHHAARVGGVSRLLSRLGEDELEDLGRLVDRCHDLLNPPHRAF
jgi:DNA-binding MarR family transcriptional regulator